MSRTVAITGASGMLGTHLAEYFRRAGWRVRALMRDPSWDPFRERGTERARLDLERPIATETLAGADILIHAAYTTRFSSLAAARRVNIEGTARLIAAARSANARFVFVSSLAARVDAPSFYGRSKFEVEQLLTAPDDLVIRPGLILAQEGGLANRLRHAIARTHVMPLFGGGSQIVQTVHVDDLCAAFERAVGMAGAASLNVAEPDGITMRDLLRLLAGAAGVRALPLPLPVSPLLTLVRALERMRVRMPFSSENLLGLTGMRRVETRADLQRLRIELRTARESLRDLFPDSVLPGGAGDPRS